MSEPTTTPGNNGAWREERLRRLATDKPEAARAWLVAEGLSPAASIARLCAATLAWAEADPDLAAGLITLASTLVLEADGDGAQAEVDYAAARLALMGGDLDAAEQRLRAAQRIWQQVGARLPLARSNLGLTQILAEQGRYAEAEAAVSRALHDLTALRTEQPELRPLEAVALRNLATLYSVQDRHVEALVTYDRVLERLGGDDAVSAAVPAVDPAEIAHLELNRSVSLMYLDRIEEADVALRAAIERFNALDDRVNRGRARTNLGALLLRTGEYGDALQLFIQALDDLLGAEGYGADLLGDDEGFVRLRRADVLFLEQGNAYLTLNLLPEAASALGRAEQIFRRTAQRYELGQVLYLRGLLHLATAELTDADAALEEAQALFEALDNRYWWARTQLGLAQSALRGANLDLAAARLAALPVWDDAAEPDATVGGFLTLEAELLRLRLALALRDEVGGRSALAGAEGALTRLAPGATFPQFRAQVAYGRGALARLAGDLADARQQFFAAIELIEQQRGALPLEEMRAAFLDDKATVYGDLILTLLDEPAPDQALIGAAFDVVARAQSRTLLERLLAAFPAATRAEPELESRRQAIYRELHWLYNRLLGEGDSRRSLATVTQAVADCESALQRIEWRRSPALSAAQPISLALLQSVLAEDEAAMVYHTTPGATVVFVIERLAVAAVQLASDARLARALREWRFQLGRAEVGPEYRRRRHEHLLRGAQGALADLYAHLVAPVRSQLRQPRLFIIPHGRLHGVPFHALFDGEHYLLEEYACTYAPDLGSAARLLRRTGAAPPAAPAALAFAGFALTEPGIPHTRLEVARAAAHFPVHQIFCDAQATQGNFRLAARRADVVHVATHGLFRSANPYFSALKLYDGWQDVRALYQLDIGAELVVLSTCESGAGHAHAGGDVIGIARGFLGAGARRLVASLWNLHDASAARLMDDFYRHLTDDATLEAAGALRAAQLAGIERNEHPYFWASFHAIQ